MTRVAGDTLAYGVIGDFFIDKFEVSNHHYKNFIERGGYQNPEYWHELTVSLNDSISWERAITFFVDQTNNPGPSTWIDGNYPDGEDDFPVSGISWFEANAYAAFTGKSLPTKDHWGLARGESTLLVGTPQLGGNAIFAPFSNFHGDGPVGTGSLNGIVSSGAYDMAGNVREWCWNESERGHWIRGGAWNDNPYMFGAPSKADPFDRSERNGFRCVLYPNPDAIPEIAFGFTTDKSSALELKLSEQISEEKFEVYKEYYGYDKGDLFAKVVSKTETGDWILEKVVIDAAYDDERFSVYIFFPANSKPPFQSVIYGPGSGVFWQENSDDIENYFEFPAFLDFFVRSGRAVIFPIIKGSFERKEETPSFLYFQNTYRFTNYITKVVKDYRRCLDYLETRNEFDMNKVVFYGMSLGPHIGAYLTAVDHRISANIFYAGGLNPIGRPEANATYFLPRIKIPTLMINGRYDSIFGLNAIMKMFNLLGTDENDKKLVLFDTDHLAYKEDLVRESLAWLDQYFGQVVYIGDVQRL